MPVIGFLGLSSPDAFSPRLAAFSAWRYPISQAARSTGSGRWWDAAASPYIWRLDRLKLARMWKERPGIPCLVRSRPLAAIVLGRCRRLAKPS